MLTALDISSATARVAPDLLKAQAILSDTTVRRSAVDQEDLKPYWKLEKRLISLGDQQSYYLSLETLRSIITTCLAGRNTGCFSCLGLLLYMRKLAPQKVKNKFFLQEKFYPLKALVHDFIVLIYLAT